jgi:hypothetical protein
MGMVKEKRWEVTADMHHAAAAGAVVFPAVLIGTSFFPSTRSTSRRPPVVNEGQPCFFIHPKDEATRDQPDRIGCGDGLTAAAA